MKDESENKKEIVEDATTNNAAGGNDTEPVMLQCPSCSYPFWSDSTCKACDPS